MNFGEQGSFKFYLAILLATLFVFGCGDTKSITVVASDCNLGVICNEIAGAPGFYICEATPDAPTKYTVNAVNRGTGASVLRAKSGDTITACQGSCCTDQWQLQ